MRLEMAQRTHLLTVFAGELTLKAVRAGISHRIDSMQVVDGAALFLELFDQPPVQEIRGTGLEADIARCAEEIDCSFPDRAAHQTGAHTRSRLAKHDLHLESVWQEGLHGSKLIDVVPLDELLSGDHLFVDLNHTFKHFAIRTFENLQWLSLSTL